MGLFNSGGLLGCEFSLNPSRCYAQQAEREARRAEERARNDVVRTQRQQRRQATGGGFGDVLKTIITFHGQSGFSANTFLKFLGGGTTSGLEAHLPGAASTTSSSEPSAGGEAVAAPDYTPLYVGALSIVGLGIAGALAVALAR